MNNKKQGEVMSLRDNIEKYVPINEQEEKDQTQMLSFIDSFDDVLTRKNVFGHFSASAFVVNAARDKMVVVYHKILNGWIYPGGHADGIEDLLSVAVREVEEETGLKGKVLDQEIFSIQSLPTPGHEKKGQYISAHNHFDCVYLMEADDSIPLVYREDESKGVKWVPFEEVSDESMVDFMRPIHKKLVKKLQEREHSSF